MGLKQVWQMVVALALTGGVVGCSSSIPAPPQATNSAVDQSVRLRPEIVATHQMNPAWFTQGLEVDGSDLLIGTGQYGESQIMRVPLSTPTASPLAQKSLPPRQFGEGITKFGDDIWQLTWQDGIAYRRDARTLAEKTQVRYPGQGWGLCATKDHLVMSDGTAQLRILDPQTFSEQRRITVTNGGQPVTQLNELECVDDQIYANRFLTSEIVRISPDGKVNATIDASALPSNAAADPNNVLNGIAALPGSDSFLLAGKRWPQMYEVRFVPAG
ncbi:glutaminyl-peptide cyclotransferase [Corynebacterium epidermidicanis]|uniref:Glutamine cyclotransferase n=1 Tax=Corynebacterium epidermidicanis TaxID=1050174 RepID=A0A0G3GN68_9CORY|nr:glutaminyl-peptide cyclotransferase [Corynebacterium epidermidicanis]AKK02604.1 glutamine cyclotransferase [Corynebacterium epidermidicanis]